MTDDDRARLLALVLDAALRALESIQEQGYFLHDASGAVVAGKDQFVHIISTALDAALESSLLPPAQGAQDLAEPAAAPVSYETPVDHYREMARRLSESRDALKHRCRELEGKLAALLPPVGQPEEEEKK